MDILCHIYNICSRTLGGRGIIHKMTQAFHSLIRGTLIICAALLCVPFFASAQTTGSATGLGLRNTDTAVLIHAEPATPAAGAVVRFTAESPLFDLTKSMITWSVNGKETTKGIGEKVIDITIDKKGTPVTVHVDVTNDSWGNASADVSIAPLQLDLLIDAMSYVPPFYRGRALPAAGGHIHAQALARFVQNGARVSEKIITYTWKQNGRTLGSISGLGRSAVTLEAPALFDSNQITVLATTDDGALSAETSATIASVEPILALYENHPLFGIMFHQMTPNSLTVPSAERTFVAIPYFADALRAEDPHLRYAWSVNDSPIAASSTKTNEITIRADSGGVVASLALELSHAVNIFLASTGRWQIKFGSPSGTGQNHGSANSDIFHTSR